MKGIITVEERTRRQRAFLLVGAWIVLAVVAVAWGLSREQEELGAASEAALREAGVTGVSVSVEGRDVVLIADGTDAGATSAVAAVDGVRRVKWEVAEPSRDGVSSTTTATGPTAAVSETTTTTTSLPDATSTPPPDSTTTTITVDETAARLTASLSEGTLVLAGALPDAETAASVAATAELIYTPFLSNNLVVDDSVETATWVPTAARAIAVLPIVGEAELEVSGEQAILSGVAGSDAKKALLEAAVQQALGPAVTIESSVSVSGKAPPLFTAEAADDGTLVLGGIMPDQATVDRIVFGAGEAYGVENVTAAIEVDPGVESTFSNFRIPLIFIQFQPIPQWNLRIENDVITGALRGGATFPFGSSELTPQLEALLDIATGILLRNPTLGATIEGHTDSVSSDAYNQILSEARAESAAAYLVAGGIDPARLTTAGFGESRPIASNDTEEGRAINRRIDFGLGPFAQGGGG